MANCWWQHEANILYTKEFKWKTSGNFLNLLLHGSNCGENFLISNYIRKIFKYGPKTRKSSLMVTFSKTFSTIVCNFTTRNKLPTSLVIHLPVWKPHANNCPSIFNIMFCLYLGHPLQNTSSLCHHLLFPFHQMTWHFLSLVVEINL